jgi:uncharacterized protein
VTYLIDGHNVIGQFPGLSLDDPQDEAKLVERLRRFMARTGKRCTVIFDGGLPGGTSRDLSTPSVQVVFAHGGTTADAIILERIRNARDPGSVVVVSADQEIISAALRRRMHILSPGVLARQINSPTVADEEDSNRHLTPDEVQEWLDLFGVESDDENDG